MLLDLVFIALPVCNEAVIPQFPELMWFDFGRKYGVDLQPINSNRSGEAVICQLLAGHRICLDCVIH